jgi:hypothetical protein
VRPNNPILPLQISPTQTSLKPTLSIPLPPSLPTQTSLKLTLSIPLPPSLPTQASVSILKPIIPCPPLPGVILSIPSLSTQTSMSTLKPILSIPIVQLPTLPEPVLLSSLPNRSVQLKGLAPEILEQILINLDVKNIKSVCQTDKYVYEFCKDGRFWVAKMNHDFKREDMLPSDYFKNRDVYLENTYENFKTYVIDEPSELFKHIMRSKSASVDWLLKYYKLGGRDVDDLINLMNRYIMTSGSGGTCYPDEKSQLALLEHLIELGVYPTEKSIRRITSDLYTLKFLHKMGKLPKTILIPLHARDPYTRSDIIPWLTQNGYFVTF